MPESLSSPTSPSPIAGRTRTSARKTSSSKPKYISVCKNVIQTNNRTIREGLDRPIEPPIRIQDGKWGGKVNCSDATLVVDGKPVGRIFYQPENAIIKAGAKVVIEFYGDVEIVS